MEDIKKGLQKIKLDHENVKSLKKYAEQRGGLAIANSSLQLTQNFEQIEESVQQIKNLIRGQKMTQIAETAKACWKTNLALSTVIGCLRIYNDYQLYINKVIEGKELAKKIARHIITVGTTTAASYGGYVGGAKLGTLISPGIGTVVGGMLGGLFAGLLTEELTSKVCKVLLNEKEYQLDVLNKEHNENIQQLYTHYVSALQRRGLNEYSSDQQIKQKKKKDSLGFHPDKFPESEKSWACQQFIQAQADYEIIKTYRKMLAPK